MPIPLIRRGITNPGHVRNWKGDCFPKRSNNEGGRMAIQGVSGEAAKMQQFVSISTWIKEGSGPENSKEPQVQQPAEQQKTESAQVLTPSPKGVGETVNRTA
jgi:hypothetical protein